MSKANVFIVLNLGCEMLYVIDQRLKAQCVSLTKSAQILRDVTLVLLDPIFIQQLSTSAVDRTALTPLQCRILFKDIACSSIMHLDTPSMDKLWDLMTMIFKWQFHTMNVVNRSDILSLTFRHLDGIGKLIPELQKQILIDETKTNLLNFWNNRLTDEDYIELNNDIAEWLACFNIKISILLRLGFQKPNGKFFNEQLHTEPYVYYSRNLGENIYTKNFSSAKVIQSNNGDNDGQNSTSADPKITNEIDKFITELNVNRKTSIYNNQNPMILDEINCSTDPIITPVAEKVVNHEFVLIKNTDTRKTINEILANLQITDDIGQVEHKRANSSNRDSDDEINFTDRLLEMLDESSK